MQKNPEKTKLFDNLRQWDYNKSINTYEKGLSTVKDVRKAEVEKAVKDYYELFEDKTTELLCLTGEKNYFMVCIGKGRYTPTMPMLAAIDAATGEQLGSGVLTWMVKGETFRRSVPRCGKRLKQLTAYRVLVRRSKDKDNKLCLLVKVLKKGIKEPYLRQAAEHYAQPVFIEHKLAAFKLNRHYGEFSAEIDWLGSPCDVNLEVDEDNGETANQALEVFERCTADIAGFDARIRREIAADSCKNYNDVWRQDDQPELTEEQFAQRLEIIGIYCFSDGTMCVDYSDDNMFWGHMVQARLEADGSMSETVLVG